MGRQVESSGLRFLEVLKETQAASAVPTHQKGPPTAACNGQRQLPAMTSRRWYTNQDPPNARASAVHYA